MLAPYCPFVADALYENLTEADESVHLAEWPAYDGSARDVDLEDEMKRARVVVSLGLAARNEAKIRVRQPLRRALVLVPGDAPFSEGVEREIADALNVKALEPVTSLEGLLDYSVVPNFRALGPKVGKRMPLVKDALASADGATVHRALDEHGTFELELGDGSTVTLGPDDIEVRVRSHEELVLAEDAGYAVALDSTLDDDLRAEGIARELDPRHQRSAARRSTSTSPTGSASASSPPGGWRRRRIATATGSPARCSRWSSTWSVGRSRSRRSRSTANPSVS